MWDWIAAACTEKIPNTWKHKMGGTPSGLETLEDCKLKQMTVNLVLVYQMPIWRNGQKKEKQL